MTVIMCSLTNNDYVHQKDYPFLLEKKVKIQLRMQIGIDRLNLLKEVKTTLEQKNGDFWANRDYSESFNRQYQIIQKAFITAKSLSTPGKCLRKD